MIPDATVAIAAWLAQRATEAIVGRAVKRVERRVGHAVRANAARLDPRCRR